MPTSLIGIIMTILHVGEVNPRKIRCLRSCHLECWERVASDALSILSWALSWACQHLSLCIYKVAYTESVHVQCGSLALSLL